MLLELCITSVAEARLATARGAARLELNSALELDGLTPSMGMLHEVKQATHLPVFVMIRPRPGDFVYGLDEFRVMQRDAETALDHGANGLVFGLLTGDRLVDVDSCRELVKLYRPAPAVFHRAFDAVAHPFDALEQLIDLGFQRVLTSGQAASALEGASTLHRLIEQAGERIEILPSGGIRAGNLARLVDLTGCTQVHASMKFFDEATSCT